MIEKDYEEKIFKSKIKDKIEQCKNKNIITYTDFLDISKKSLALEVIKEEKFKNYIINNNIDEFDRNVIVFYPEKLDIEIAEKYFEKIIDIIRIEIPKQLEYEHRVYLSGIMKFGIKREKFGDILVNDKGANIIIFKDISEYVLEELKKLTRFQKSKIEIINYDLLEKTEIKFEEKKIIVSSLRLDNIIAEIAGLSRTKAKEVIEEGRVFINNKNEFKTSKLLNINDVINIRGKGKYIFEGIENRTKKDNLILLIKKYI